MYSALLYMHNQVIYMLFQSTCTCVYNEYRTELCACLSLIPRISLASFPCMQASPSVCIQLFLSLIPRPLGRGGWGLPLGGRGLETRPALVYYTKPKHKTREKARFSPYYKDWAALSLAGRLYSSTYLAQTQIRLQSAPSLL